MTDSTIKIYNARYSKLMKLLDFFAVNLVHFRLFKILFRRTLNGLSVPGNHIFADFYPGE